MSSSPSWFGKKGCKMMESASHVSARFKLACVAEDASYTSRFTAPLHQIHTLQNSLNYTVPLHHTYITVLQHTDPSTRHLWQCILSYVSIWVHAGERSTQSPLKVEVVIRQTCKIMVMKTRIRVPIIGCLVRLTKDTDIRGVFRYRYYLAGPPHVEDGQ